MFGFRCDVVARADLARRAAGNRKPSASNSASRVARFFSAVAFTSLLLGTLAACGGGGGGADSAPSPTSSPAAAPIALTSGSLTFGSTNIGGTSATQTITLSNTGNAALSITSISSSNAAFKIVGGTCAAPGSVAGGASCTVALTFSPSASGAANASLAIAHNASPAVSTVTLSGTGSATTNPDLVTSVTPATYAAGTTEKGAWDLLMAQRTACGFGLLQQDSRLDTASAAHSSYLVKNSLDRFVNVLGHFEDPTWNYFTGNAPWDRTAHAGFPASVIEILNQFYSVQSNTAAPAWTAGEALGASSMRGLIETVYHARGAFWGGRSGGVGSVLATGPTGQAGANQTQYRIVSEISDEADALKQKLGSANIATWPCAGLTSVGGTFRPATESPNPFPDVTNSSTIYGTPVYLKADPGSVLVVSAATITKVSDGSTLAYRQLTKANDTVGEITDNEVFLVPTTALAAGSSYTVHAVGTLNGVALTKDFSFSTAP